MRNAGLFLILVFTPAAFGQLPSFDPPGLPGTQLKSFDDGAKVSVSVNPAQAKPGEVITVSLTLAPEIGCWTYPTQVDQTSRNIISLPKDESIVFLPKFDDPPGAKTKKDGMKYYPGEVTWTFRGIVKPNAKPGKKELAFKNSILQICNESNCFNSSSTYAVSVDVLPGPAVNVPPEFQALVAPPITTPAAAPPKSAAAESSPTKDNGKHQGIIRTEYRPIEEYTKRLNEQLATLEIQPVKRQGGLGTLLITAAAWGLISLVTPCVFPMIPITVSLFLKQSNNSTGQAVKLALTYCATIIVVMSLAALFALSSFRTMSAHWLTNILLGVLFIVLALSLFGMFTLQLPSSLLRFADNKRKSGGTIGTVFGAIAFSIVSFTCVAPFLGGFAGMASSGQYRTYELAIASISFATAFASPFFVLALFPSLLKALPKSGGWLDTVKAVMGFLELAAALKFFRSAELLLTSTPNFFTYSAVMAAWVVIYAATGLYLLRMFRLPHDDEPGPVSPVQMIFAISFLSLAVYLLPATWKTETGAQRPNGVVFSWIDAFLLPDAAASDQGHLPWRTDLSEAISAARAEKKLVFVDVTGVLCTNCNQNENSVFPLPKVQSALQKYSLVELYTDMVPEHFFTSPVTFEQRREQAVANIAFQKAFGTEQLPFYVIIEPTATGARVLGTYDEGLINNVEAFTKFLTTPLESR